MLSYLAPVRTSIALSLPLELYLPFLATQSSYYVRVYTYSEISFIYLHAWIERWEGEAESARI